MKRNLLFHLYPRKESIWRWHVEQLLTYAETWNGRRIVIASIDGATEKPDPVTDALCPLNAEVIFRKNSPELGETAHFLEGMSLLKSLDNEEATFYAHAKGTSKVGGGFDIGPIKRWSHAMYALNLEDIPLIESILHGHLSVGCFRHFMKHAGSSWHYSGTFFWLKHSGIFSRRWRDIDDGRWGVEGYPGRHIKSHECATLTPDDLTPKLLYETGVSESLLNKYREELKRRR